ncbi:nitroreductase family protein [Psychrobacter raelei]|uniref:Nitroreductase n=1 Tax=Psychrobacter sp. (strain PRwf-1) TaxID=349106 RepID=A5WG73_PSYWF
MNNDNSHQDSNANAANLETANNEQALSPKAPYLEAFKNVVESRRSVRRFTDTPISDDVLRDCLRLAMLAPNSSNLQPWEFYVINTPKKRAKANQICMNQNGARTANRLIAVVARTDTWRDNAKQNIRKFPDGAAPKKVRDYYERIVPLDFLRGPAGIISIAKWGMTKAVRQFKGPVKSPYYTYEDIKNWAMYNTALAAENLILALRAHGFDSCAMGGFDEPALKKLLKLGNHHHVVMMIGAGERADNGIYHSQFRFDYDQFVKEV